MGMAALLLAVPSPAQKLIPAGEGWAGNSVNVTVFRKNSLVTHGNLQFIAYYDADGYVVLGKRKRKTDKWTLRRTRYRGNVRDAHNTISIMADGEGYLHMAWNHHNRPLQYVRSTAPLSLELGEPETMTGQNEMRVTYPEFYRMPDGGLLFLYRDGQSGQGNLVLNRYDLKSRKWIRLHDNLIDGEGERNAYSQTCVDEKGVIHVSWVWREAGDVASNHDLCYACSPDGGVTWQKSDGEKYTLPIRAASAEYVCRIPQNSELINQTSMTADDLGRPYIASYWREAGSEVPQYHVVYYDGKVWHDRNTGFRSVPFTLRGGGTKRIPISRPQVVTKTRGTRTSVYLIFRDAERNDRISVAVNPDIGRNEWNVVDLTSFGVGSWDPPYDTELWKNEGRLHLFVQRATQVDGEGVAQVPPERVQVLEVKLEQTAR